MTTVSRGPLCCTNSSAAIDCARGLSTSLSSDSTFTNVCRSGRRRAAPAPATGCRVLRGERKVETPEVPEHIHAHSEHVEVARHGPAAVAVTPMYVSAVPMETPLSLDP